MAKNKNLIGGWAFLIGVLLALVVGVLSVFNIDMNTSLIAAILMGLGIIIGLLNITAKESMPFLLSGTALILASFFGMISTSTVPVAGAILVALLEIFVPATIIVAIKNVFNLAKD